MFRVITRAHSLHSAFLTAGLSVVFVVGYIGLALYVLPELHSVVQLRATEAGVASELLRLQGEGNGLAKVPAFTDTVQRGDASEMFSILSQAQTERNIERLAVADRAGFLVSRTNAPDVLGDNIFLTSSVGRTLAAGRLEAASVGPSALNPDQVLLTTGRWIIHGGDRVGILFAITPANDAFSRRFAQSYLAPDTEIIFYTREFGIYGSSFKDAGDRALVASFAHQNSGFVKTATDDMRVVLPDGRTYIIRNLVFQGAEASSTGALVFVPVGHVAFLFVALLFPAALFAGLAFILHRRNREHFRLYFMSLVTGSVLFLIISAGLYYFIHGQFHLVRSVRYPLYNSVLRISPESGVFSSKYSRAFSVFLDTGGEAVNAVATSITYDPSMLTIESLDTENSVCEHFVRNAVDPGSGTITVDCIIPNPGFSGATGLIGVIHVHARQTGTMSLHFGDGTQVLANDGLGTNVLRTTTDASIQFQDASLGKPGSLAVYSPSHPDPARWYSRSTVSLVWLPASPITIDVVDSSAAGFHRTFTNISPPFSFVTPRDGAYTFILNAASGTAATYIARVDTGTSLAVRVEASDTTVSPGSVVRLRISGSNDVSGLQRTYYLKVDDDLFYPVGSEAYVPISAGGVHMLTVRAFDNAGNFKDTDVSINVAPIVKP